MTWYENYEMQNCRPHLPTQFCSVLVSFQRKEAHYFEKNEKIVTLTNYFIHPFPCFHLKLNKIPLNKTKNGSDV